jgi:hypothetical protein
MKVNKAGILATVAGAAMIAAPQVARACAMCGLPPNDHESHAFNTSVLFMLSAPYAIFGVFAAGIYLAYRSAMKKRRIAAAEPSR